MKKSQQQKRIKKFLLGSDPEVFLWREETQEYFPAIGVNTGTKDKPLQMEGLAKGFTWQIDGLALEFNTPPASNVGEWVTNHMIALNFLKENIPQELNLNIISSVTFDEKYLELPGAMELGCNPDFNVWTQSHNPTPQASALRTTSGHLHIGFEEGKDITLVEEVIKAIDLFLAVPSILIDEDTTRRQLYGQAGSFRFGKSYIGCEARVLSNFWLKNEELMAWVYNRVEDAIDFVNNNGVVDNIVQLCIDNHDKELAKKIIDKYNIKLPETYYIYEAAEKQ